MLTQLRIQNFKSWADTGAIRMAPITGFFGANSSGKSSLLQFLLLLKQSVETTDPTRTLNLGDEQSVVQVGAVQDIFHQHDLEQSLRFEVSWKSRDRKSVSDVLRFSAVIEARTVDVAAPPEFIVRDLVYSAGDSSAQMSRVDELSLHYYLVRLTSPSDSKEVPLPHGNKSSPIRFYGFPSDAKGRLFSLISGADQQRLYLADSDFEHLFSRVFYLGPLRDYPRRSYLWRGERPRDVGSRGEATIHALIASQRDDVTRAVTEWLRKLGLVSQFRLQPVSATRSEYEVALKTTKTSPEVFLTDVGFGISQVLPVLTLCYYVPPGSTIVLEQPEIHLHPSVQSGLADVLIDVATKRGLQIILESHSEHLLRRLQRRIAEQAITADQTALYFCALDQSGASQLTALRVDEFGNISNWPKDFFGNDLADLAAMTRAEMTRRQAA